MTATRAWIAAPLPPTSQWVLLKSPRDLPPGMGIFGSITIGAPDRPKLSLKTSARSLVPPGGAPRHLCPDCPLRASQPQLLEEVPP
jgi:hypothetical protein